MKQTLSEIKQNFILGDLLNISALEYGLNKASFDYFYLNAHLKTKSVFIDSCTIEDLSIIKWLYSLGRFKRSVLERAFFINSKRGNKDIMEWLHDVGEIQPVIIDLALSFQL